MTSSKAPPAPTQTLAPVEVRRSRIHRGIVGRSPHLKGTQYGKSRSHTSLSTCCWPGCVGNSLEEQGDPHGGQPGSGVDPVSARLPEGCIWACQSALYAVRTSSMPCSRVGSPTVFFPEREVTKERRSHRVLRGVPAGWEKFSFCWKA